jgi:hypothetical protein
MPNHLNQLQLARRWSMSPRTLERWRWTGVGPRFLKVGKRVVYPLAVVEAFEAELLHASTTTVVPLRGDEPNT